MTIKGETILYQVTTEAQRRKLQPVFEPFTDSMLDSYFEGKIGTAWCDDLSAPTCGLVNCRDITFLYGDARSAGAGDLAGFRPLSTSFMLIPGGEPWHPLILHAHENIAQCTRYAMARDASGFDMAALRAHTRALPDGYTLHRMNAVHARQALAQPWSEDLCAGFPTPEAFVSDGIGYCVLRGDEFVAGAASFTVFDSGIEIQIDTREDQRRKGLALACAAALMLDCLANDKFPCWDAAHRGSLALAEKLGYRLAREYTAFLVPALVTPDSTPSE